MSVEGSAGALINGGRLRVDARVEQSSLSGIQSHIGNLLQVRNLAFLIGSGASFHLGLPRLRGQTKADIASLLEKASGTATDDENAVLDKLVGAATIDVEDLFAALSTAIAFAYRFKVDPVVVADRAWRTEVLVGLRAKLNRALVHACDLANCTPATFAKADPFRTHREFIRRLLRTRRPELPRVRLFTTNYDLAIESALDDAGISYVDGFAGTVTRTFRPESFDRDLYLSEVQGGRRVRVSDVLYLFKLHGSLNWRAKRSDAARGANLIVQATTPLAAGDLAVIYPTPTKEEESLSYPYADLLRAFQSAISSPETALVILGFGFADPHINRVIYSALASDPTFQLFVVSPHAVWLDGANVSNIPPATKTGQAPTTPINALAAAVDARISVLTGPIASFHNFVAHAMPDPDPDAAEDALVQGKLAAALLGTMAVSSPAEAKTESG
jgi:hypothetical protein